MSWSGPADDPRAPVHPVERSRGQIGAAFVALGQGLLDHPRNHALRDGLRTGALSPRAYVVELHALLFGVVLLLHLEERGAVPNRASPAPAKQLYRARNGLGRLRERARPSAEPRGVSSPSAPCSAANDAEGNEWTRLVGVLCALGHGDERMGLLALGGIFARVARSVLREAMLDDHALLVMLSHLCWRPEPSGPVSVRWDDMAPEELGRLYEALLEIDCEATRETDVWRFAPTTESRAHARRRSGSYYTPDKLVRVLLDRALEPVVELALVRAEPQAVVDVDRASRPAARALLDLAIVDPACGTGYILLAAARRLGARLAALRAEGAPGAADARAATAEVVTSCLYGVDCDPIAVELCRASLWLETSDLHQPIDRLACHIRVGNALLGTDADRMADGIPDAAWSAYEEDDRRVARALKQRNGRSVVSPLFALRARPTDKLLADGWCAAFFWPKRPGLDAESAPTNDRWLALRDESRELPAAARARIEALAAEHRFLHWPLEFPEVFGRGGFDLVLGNPPWIAHAGRAAQPIDSRLKGFFATVYESFAGYPTTHGMFVEVSARILREGGQLGLVVPSSLAELDGYEPTRRAHDRRCGFSRELVDFGEGQFEAVTQPCMALVSERTRQGRSDAAPGTRWPVERPDLAPRARELLERLARGARLPAALFGERGVQSDRRLALHFRATASPEERFSTPIREGTDVRQFELRPPRIHVDRAALGRRIRDARQFEAVAIVVRQTARYPIAARSDGKAFRNSLLAAFERPEWPADALVALLNSALVRFLHYQRFRDARQPIMPQVKIGHLQAIPAPVAPTPGRLARLAELGARLSAENRGIDPAAREALDALAAELYGLDADEQELVRRWHDEHGPAPIERR